MGRGSLTGVVMFVVVMFDTQVLLLDNYLP